MQLTALPDKPDELRGLIRKGELVHPTSGMAPGRVQANLAILPRDTAYDFLLFCQRNPKPCPLLEVVDAGETEARQFAPSSDLRTDVPLYRIYQHGEMVSEVEDISEFWRDDLVSFLLGCSFSFETALIRAGISMRHIECDTNVPMFITNIPTTPAGAFSGPMVVSMRPIPREQVVRAIQVTSRFPAVHGAPVHIGDPEAIGISDITRPDFGDPVAFEDGDVPVFWACGVTPQAVAMSVKLPLMITHAPGHMFITDKKDEDLAVL
ncbi:MAG: putative hydro-lyase [Chloroflexi bacterium]|nr:putative hydro-lyase [Chloroflexota bacterium]